MIVLNLTLAGQIFSYFKENELVTLIFQKFMK